MSHPTPFRSAFAAGRCTPADVLDFHRRTFGHLVMEDESDKTDPPQLERPDGVSDEEWAALGDPGKKALVRERERATKAETDLAAARAAAKTPKPTPPAKNEPPKTDPPSSDDNGTPDVAAIVQQAVEAALKPFRERDEQREAEAKARTVIDAVTTAAKDRMHDPSDAVAGLDLATLTTDAGTPDTAKIKAAIDDLVQRKPHLAKAVDDRRRFAPDAPLGGGSASAQSEADRVKAALERMQAAAGVKLAGS